MLNLAKARIEHKDYRAALRYVKRAEELGEPVAVNLLGTMYLQGWGVATGLEYLRKAADAGHRNSMNSLGTLYVNGQGITQDFEQARFWFQKGADAGHATSMRNLAQMYNKGDGVKKDPAKALLDKAAALGNQDARRDLKIDFGK